VLNRNFNAKNEQVPMIFVKNECYSSESSHYELQLRKKKLKKS